MKSAIGGRTLPSAVTVLLLFAGVSLGHGGTPVFYQVDLTGCTTNRLDSHTDSSDCWSVVPRGLQTLGNIPFRLENILEVTGMGALRQERKFYPTRFSGIPVGRKATALHVLHGVGYADPDGTPIGKLTLQYEDGSEQSLYLIYGVNTRNWWRERSETKSEVTDPKTVVAWSYTETPWNLRLFRTSFENPHPERIIKSIGLFSLFSRSTPVVVGITLEENSARPKGSVETGLAVDEAAFRQELVVKILSEDGRGAPGAVCRFTLNDGTNTMAFGERVADERGHLVADYPAGQVVDFGIQVRAAGYIPTVVGFTNEVRGSLPKEKTLTLARGVEIGGVVRNAGGQPLSNVTVTVLSIERDAVGQSIEREIDIARTDRDGRWSCGSVAPDTKSLTFKLSHPEMRPAEYYMVEQPGGTDELARSELLARKGIMILQPGIVIAGTALNQDGKPLNGAVVFLRENGEEPVDRAGRTDETGHFKFTVMHTGEGVLALSANGFAPAAANVTFEDGVKPVDFKLEPAKALKGQVLSTDGKPVADATVSLLAWNDLPFPKWETRTDSEGRFSWDSAPLKGAMYVVRKSGFGTTIPQELLPGDSEAVLRLVRNGMVTGTVVDAETKKPIPSFHVIRGRVFGGDDISWDRYQPASGDDGNYTSTSEDNSFMSVRLLVEAEGYLPEVSPTLSAQGWTTNNFELKKGHGPRGIVKLPNGKPAEGAQVALLAGDYIQLKERELERRSSGRGQTASQVKTDDSGHFSLPALYATQLVAVHPDGYGEVALTCLSTNLEITLQPWGEITGTVRNGKHPATNVMVMVTAKRSGSFGMSLQYDFESYRTRSDDQGRFVLTNVPPGERYLVRLYPMQRGWSWSHGESVPVHAGIPTEVQFGGRGRMIKGKVVPSDSKREISWDIGHHVLGTHQPRPPSAVRTREEIEAWNNSPEVKEARAKYRYYVVQFESDGSFHIDDVPPGVYDLNLQFNQPGTDQFRMGTFIGSIQQEVEVPEMPNGLVEEPLDLGELELQVR